MNKSLTILGLLLAPFVTTSTAVAQELEDMIYSTAGYTGTVDDGSYDTARILWGAFSMRTGLPVGRSATMKYRLSPEPGMYEGAQVLLGLRYRDPGPSTRILFRLYEYNQTSGATHLRMIFDTDQFPQRSSAQSWVLASGSNPGWDLDFRRSAYYLQVSILQTGSGAPGTVYSMNVRRGGS